MNNKTFIDTYGDEEVQFHSYWKYTFTFCNLDVLVSIGGEPADIYRLDVNAKPIKVKDLLLDWETFSYEVLRKAQEK
ncbi:hypothetical protein UFOVP11_66 [uncultured Caudovirales phage]|uniref:Uncharacterized protein n=1 Tax=uncultured Caudovirales phage TaxID=2100421 RepID=A0A6J5KJE4_9CAUD|nr:hypothetical protein UFOVP11_66 [uncultured Caudovirales phage]